MLLVSSIILIVIPVRKGSIHIFVVPTLSWLLFNHGERKVMIINILVFIVAIHTNIRFEFFFIVVIVVIVVVVGDDDDRFIYGSIVIISHDDSGYSSGSFGLEAAAVSAVPKPVEPMSGIEAAVPGEAAAV